MLLEKEQVIMQENWMAASKHKSENQFFVQKCNPSKGDSIPGTGHKQRLWEAWNRMPDMNFYFFIVEIPVYEK
jgi:hypothetical protein